MPNLPRPRASPPWLEFFNKHRNLMLPVSLGLAVLLVLAVGIFRAARKSKRRRDAVEAPEELALPSGSYTPPPLVRTEQPAPQFEALGAAPQISEGDREQLADRVRQVAKRDPAATANVLRMWLQDGES